MNEAPVTTDLNNGSHSRQKEVVALLQEQARTIDELMSLMTIKRKGNLKKSLEALISKGKIVPNPTTGKYELHP